MMRRIWTFGVTWGLGAGACAVGAGVALAAPLPPGVTTGVQIDHGYFAVCGGHELSLEVPSGYVSVQPVVLPSGATQVWERWWINAATWYPQDLTWNIIPISQPIATDTRPADTATGTWGGVLVRILTSASNEPYTWASGTDGTASSTVDPSWRLRPNKAYSVVATSQGGPFGVGHVMVTPKSGSAPTQWENWSVNSLWTKPTFPGPIVTWTFSSGDATVVSSPPDGVDSNNRAGPSGSVPIWTSAEPRSLSAEPNATGTTIRCP